MNDAPLNYQELWYKLRALMQVHQKQSAVTAATAKEDWQIRRAQGGYEMARTLMAVMDDIKSREQGAASAFEDDDDSLKH